MGGIRYLLGRADGAFAIKACERAVHAFRPHFHAEVSLALVEGGTSLVEAEGRVFDFTGPLLVLIPAGMAHKCSPRDPEQWRFRMLYINADWFDATFSLPHREIPFSFTALSPARFVELRRLFGDLENGRFGGVQRGALLRHIGALIRIGPPAAGRMGEDPEVAAVKGVIDAEFLRPLALDALCGAAGMNKFRLIRQFKRWYGLPPHQYATTLRINFAKPLIAAGIDVADVALASGFYDQSHFTRCFRAYTGVTPGRYRPGPSNLG